MSVNRKYTSPWKSKMLFYKWWKLTQYIFILRFLCDPENMFAISENGMYFEHIMCFKILIMKSKIARTHTKRFTNIEMIVVVQWQSHVPSLWLHELQHVRLPCPSLSSWVCSHNVLLLKISKRDWTWDSTKHANGNEYNNKTNSNNLQI